MLGGDRWLGVVEKIAAKTLLAQIELELKTEGRRKYEAAKKSLKAGKTRKEDIKKRSLTTNSKQPQSPKVTSQHLSCELNLPEPLKDQVTTSKSEKQIICLQFNQQEGSKLTKPISSSDLRNNEQKNYNLNNSKKQKSFKEALMKNGNSDEGRISPVNADRLLRNVTNLNAPKNLQGLASGSVYNLAYKSGMPQKLGPKRPILSPKKYTKEEKSNKIERTEIRNVKLREMSKVEEEKAEEKSKSIHLKDCNPICIIPPCPSISEFGNSLRMSESTKIKHRKVSTKAKSSIEIPIRFPEPPKTPQLQSDREPKAEIKAKAQIKAKNEQEPCTFRRRGLSGDREVPKKWKAGTHISTTVLGVRKPQPRFQRSSVPRTRPHPSVPPSLDAINNNLCSSSSLVQLMLLVEDALNAERHYSFERGRTELLTNKFKEELNKALIYPDNSTAEKHVKSNVNKSKNASTNKKIRISECSDVKGFMEMLAGTREYNWKTKSTVQHRPAESPWLSMLLPKEEGDNSNNDKPQKKVIVIPEVDPMTEIVEACVEKELKRCDGFANVKKAKCRDFTKERVLLCYEQSAIEKYSPFTEPEQINDIFLKFGLPYILNAGKKLGITLSAAELNQIPRRKALGYLPTPETPCTPMSEKFLKVTKPPKRKNNAKDNRKRKTKKRYHKKGHKIFCKRNAILEDLQKQIDITPPYIFDNDKSLTDLNFEQEPKTYINLSESTNCDLSENESSEFYVADYVVDRNKTTPTYAFRMTPENPRSITIHVQQVINALGKAQDILLKIPSGLLDCSKKIPEVNGLPCTSAVEEKDKTNTQINTSEGTFESNANKNANSKLDENVQEKSNPKKEVEVLVHYPIEEKSNSTITMRETPMVSNVDSSEKISIIEKEIGETKRITQIGNKMENLQYSEVEVNVFDLSSENALPYPMSSQTKDLPDKNESNDNIQNDEIDKLINNSEEDLENVHKSVSKLEENTLYNQSEETNSQLLSEVSMEKCDSEGEIKKNGSLVDITNPINDQVGNISEGEDGIEKTVKFKTLFTLQFLLQKRCFISPNTGKMLGYVRSENILIKTAGSVSQWPVTYHQIIKEAISSFYDPQSILKGYYAPEVGGNNKEGLMLIKDMFKSVSINTINNVRRPPNCGVGSIIHNVFYVHIIQPISSIFRQEALNDKMRTHFNFGNKIMEGSLIKRGERLDKKVESSSKDFLSSYINAVQNDLHMGIDKISEITTIDKSDLILFLKVFSHSYSRCSKPLSTMNSSIWELEADMNKLACKMEKRFQEVSEELVEPCRQTMWRKKQGNLKVFTMCPGKNIYRFVKRNSYTNMNLTSHYKLLFFVTWLVLVLRILCIVCLN